MKAHTDGQTYRRLKRIVIVVSEKLPAQLFLLSLTFNIVAWEAYLHWHKAVILSFISNFAADVNCSIAKGGDIGNINKYTAVNLYARFRYRPKLESSSVIRQSVV